MCRICFSDDIDKENPLISPCKCSGSMQYVHLKCLRQWLSRNENKKIGPFVTSYTWKAFHCELCKEKLEDQYIHQNETHQIFEKTRRFLHAKYEGPTVPIEAFRGVLEHLKENQITGRRNLVKTRFAKQLNGSPRK